MAGKWRLIQWLLVVVLLLNACTAPANPQKTAPSATSTLPATNTPRATSALRTTNTPQPTSTLRPTYTPRPTSTLRPTYTPRPTGTLRPTNTPRPTSTLRVTSTPSATSTPNVIRAPTGTPAPTISAAQLPRVDASMVAALTRRLTASTSVADAVAATREVLALGGLGTWDGERFLVQAAAPAASGFVIPEETLVLAMEARQRPTAGHLTLAQLGDMLQDFGWPFPEGRIPSEELRDMFRAWVSDGLAQPEAPLSFTPLFLREMALTQQPAIDLAQGDYDPEQLHLTLLELELFAAHFDRISRAATETSWNRVPGLAMPAAQGDDLCSALTKWLEAVADDAGVAAGAAARIVINNGLVGPGIRGYLQSAGLSEGQAKGFGKALIAISIACKIIKMVGLYTSAMVEVAVVGANPVHAPQASEGSLQDRFQAWVGVPDRDWREYQSELKSSEVWRNLRDCAAFYGLPVFPDLGDIGNEVKDWKVEWRLEGAPEWVRINMDDNTWYHPGILRMKLAPDGDHSATADLVVEILPEKGPTYGGPEKRATAVASAEAYTAKPPSMVTWANAIRGGLGNKLALANALTELCAGWIVTMLPPKAYANLTVLYHQGGGGWSGRITYKRTKTTDETKTGTDPWGQYAFSLHDFEHESRTVTVDVSGGKLRNKTQLEETWDLSGVATVVYEDEYLWDHWSEHRGCKDDIATEHEQTYSMTRAGGTGPVTGTLTINLGTWEGTRPRTEYDWHFVSLNDLPGTMETQSNHWWDNKPCVDDDDHTQDSIPWTVDGDEASALGTQDPENPGVLSGHYELKDGTGYTITVTWNLKLKP